MATESPRTINAAETHTTGNGGNTNTASGWLTVLKTRLGLPGGQTLRDSIEAALTADEAGPETFSAEERAMLLRLLRFGTLRIEDVMVPRADIIAIDENETVGRALQLFVEGGVSRIPLYHDTLDDPGGMVHVKDLVRWIVKIEKPKTSDGAAAVTVNEDDVSEPPGEDIAAEKASADEPVESVAATIRLKASEAALSKPLTAAKVRRPVLYVPPSMPAMNLLIRMQSTRIHMALGVDDYGGTDGLVTIEDLVEEIVGEIEDEHDELEADHITGDAASGMIATARTPIDDMEERLGVKLVSDDDSIFSRV